MPLTGTGPILGLAIKTARESAAKAFLASKGQLTEADMPALAEAIAKAEGEAIVAHILVNATVIGAVAGTAVTGTIT